MKKSFSIKNYQINTELEADNTIACLSDFQIDTLLNISNNDNFSTFKDFDFLFRCKDGKITVTWYTKRTHSKFEKTMVIGVKKILTSIKTTQLD
jgi:hypothetical protein